MSRFYRALQEASRSSLNTPGTLPAGPLLPNENGTAAAAVPANGDQNGPVPENATQEPKAPQAELYAQCSSARVVMDKAAPLIPNALDPGIVDYYRRLRAKIIQEQKRKPFRSLVVASPAPGEGKSITALNLALSFGMLPDYRVLLVDGDLRKGTLGELFGMGNHPGLNNLIEGSAELEDVVLKCEEIPVWFMTRGSAPTPPAELLHSPRLIPQLRRMTEYFSLVIVDSPAVNLVADAQLLAAGCDAVLLVARAFATTRKSLQSAAQELSAYRMIGAVLNRGIKAELYRHYETHK